MGGATAQAQIAADALGVPYEAVRVEYGDSELPTGPMAGGSAADRERRRQRAGRLREAQGASVARPGPSRTGSVRRRGPARPS